MRVTKPKGYWILCLAVGLTACFGVFVLPFFFPPASGTVVSVSNDAGFNNKISAVAAATCAAGVFLLYLWKPQLMPSRAYVEPDSRPLTWRAVTAAALFVGVCEICLGTLVASSPRRFPGDVDYFINQMTSHFVYHRQLYSQIEFPYGPLLFYPPILLHALFRGVLSIKQSFFIVMVLHHVIGIFLLGYLVNSFPMSRRWKAFALWCFAIFTLLPMQGPNYTLLRFTLPLAILIFSIRQRRAWRTALLLVSGQILTLTTSPEMGFAFAAAAVFFGLFQAFRVNWRWLGVVLLIPIGAGVFLFIVGTPYLRMLTLFAGGAYNFIVEPLPYMLLFLLGTVWLVPRMLAARLRNGEQDAALLSSCFVLSMALLPVALGRADPVHVFFNGIGIFLLSMTAISLAPSWQQRTWGCLFAGTLVFGQLLIYRVLVPEFHWVVRQDIYTHQSSYPVRTILKVDRIARDLSKFYAFQIEPFDIAKLETIVKGETVATPLEISLQTENLLKQHRLYRPDFYYFTVAVLDVKGEQRKVDALNQAHWALLPSRQGLSVSERQDFQNKIIGSMLTYPSKKPFIMGLLFSANLRERWKPVDEIGQYTLYRNVRPE